MEYPRPAKYDTPDLGLVLRLVSQERLVPDALLNAEAKIRWLEARIQQMSKNRVRWLNGEVDETILQDARSKDSASE